MTNDIDKKTLDGELQLDELKEAAGGRYLTGNELDGYFEIDTWIQCKRKDLLSKCRKAEVRSLVTRLMMLLDNGKLMLRVFLKVQRKLISTASSNPSMEIF